MKKEYGDYVEDILDSMDAVEEFIQGRILRNLKETVKPFLLLSEGLRL